MKSKDEIKAALHQLIDGIDDESLLNLLMDDIVPYMLAQKLKEPDPEEGSDSTPDTDPAIENKSSEAHAANWESFKFDRNRNSTNN
ncbi:MAG TPA: hypothetical protein PLC48_12120 [Ferruginibacter sp.]|nr:hypothetical protein [Ferruginibacter sp.]